ncbi:ABC transporter substrate-binding protein [Ovoidimarina sediminis]|uniref:ABC transporter substrate-binding protein n=1 Tax=Ovoidimarina sediminis TaxID=3079856 RepID=UPI00290CDB9C|nr:ABC transporter substrate-binding protein [Rhodophyticola sp. MJ-SS7]MDU8944312.1 ABC transporter substrate-binding protein [Rhodophyticola sp. MJ-SS7]
MIQFRHFVRSTILGTVASAAFGASALAETTFIVAVPSDPGQFNPAITTGAHVHAVADSIFNGLVALDENLEPIPDLATSWTVSDDGTTYTFTLAEAAWHDGAPFTSEDVKFTFEEVLFQHHARTKSGLSGVVSSIETPDPRTVVFRLSSPHPALLRRFDVTEAPILPKHLYEGAGDPTEAAQNASPVGTGPYRFVSHAPGDRVVLEKNSDYFKGDTTDVDKVVFRIIQDAETALLAFERGEVDYIPRIGGQNIVRAEDAGQVLTATAGPGGGNCIMTVSFNLESELLQPADVRRAIALGIDRERLNDQVLFGRGNVAEAPFSSAIGWAHAAGSLSSLGHDPASASAALDAAGLEPGADGIRAEIDMVHFPTFSKYAELMAQDLAKVGIRLTSRPLDRPAAIDAIFKARDFDTNLISYCNGVDPEIGIKRMYVSNNIGPIPFSNASAYRNEKVDALFAAAGSTADQGERARAYGEIQTILAEDLPYFWLVETVRITAASDGFTGYRPWTGHYLETIQIVE